MAYERKIHWWMERRFGVEYIPQQWFAYHWRGQIRFAQPDGLLILPKRRVLLIVEVKYTHTPDAYWQIEHTYVPLMRCFLGQGNPWQIATVEVVKWFDPATRFPVKPTLCADLTQTGCKDFNVHILNPRGD